MLIPSELVQQHGVLTSKQVGQQKIYKGTIAQLYTAPKNAHAHQSHLRTYTHTAAWGPHL